MKCVLVTILLCIGYALAEIESGGNVNDELSKFADQLPPEVQGKLGEQQMEDVQNTLKEKCKKVSNSDETYEKAIQAKDVLEQCVKSQVNVTELQQEIEDAKPTGDLDTVFGKYCRKTPVVIECVKEFLKSVDPCLEEQEKVSKTLLVDLTVSVTDFLCFKDGDRIAMFIAEGGIDCLQDHQAGMQQCANQTHLAKNYSSTSEIPTVDNIPLLVIDKAKCEDFVNLQTCIVEELEKCKEPTPANIIESFFKFVRKHLCDHLDTPAKKNTLKGAEPSSSDALHTRISVITIMFSLVLRYL